jgi:hypothetical protein
VVFGVFVALALISLWQLLRKYPSHARKNNKDKKANVMLAFLLDVSVV